MRTTTLSNLGTRLVFGAALIAVSLAVAGCGTVTANASATGSTHAKKSPAKSTPATPRPSATPSHFTLTSSPSGSDVYEDDLAGYSVTFPGQPDVKPLAISGTNRLGNIALYYDTTTFGLIARGEVRDAAPDLQTELFGWLQSITPTGEIKAGGSEFDGLPDAQAQFTDEGLPSETIMANDGDRFFQLIAIGGTAKQRQAFFDSFRLTKG
jgi:hypothetical protein